MISDLSIQELNITRDDILAASPGPTKTSYFRAVIELISHRTHLRISDMLKDARLSHEQLYGPEEYASNVDEWWEQLLFSIRDLFHEELHEVVNSCWPDLEHTALYLASMQAEEVRNEYKSRPGALLSSFGITAADYGASSAATGLDAIEDAEDPAPVTEDQTDPATRAEVVAAWRDMFTGFAMDQTDLAKKLGISKSTVASYGAGKTQARCTREQARFLAEDCRARAHLFARAAKVFERVR